MTTLQVNEIFTSVQGEGVLSGCPCTFIRLQGCPVGCPWCDSGPLASTIVGNVTRNTWGAKGIEMTVEDIIDSGLCNTVVITGGEPTMQPEGLSELVHTLYNKHSIWTQLETAGVNTFDNLELVDWVTWSPKRRRNFWCHPDIASVVSEVKFVVDEELTLQDIDDTLQWLDGYRFSSVGFFHLVLMPEGCPPSKAMIDKALQFVKNIDYKPIRVTDRLQYRFGVR